MRAGVSLTVVFVALLAGCSGHRSSGRHPSDPDRACRGGVPFYSASPPYAGAGPHRLIGFQLDDYDRDKYTSPDPPVLPRAWAADHDAATRAVFVPAPDETDYKRAQLALCMSGPRVTGTRVGECRYSIGNSDVGEGGTPYDVVSAYYDFKVFEVRTGRLITSFKLDGEDAYGCPESLLSSTDGIASGIDPDTLAAKLRGLVEGHPR